MITWAYRLSKFHKYPANLRRCQVHTLAMPKSKTPPL